MATWQDAPLVTIRIHGTEYLNPRRVESLTELVGELRENGCDGEMAYRPPSGLGVPLWEVVMLFIGLRGAEATVSTVVNSVETSVIDWLKNRFRRAAEGETHERKKKVTIYGPDGKPLKTITATTADDITVTDHESDDGNS
jgi:hypothetical protein